MDAQTEFAAEIFKTLTQEQKDAILDLVSKIAAHEKGLYIRKKLKETILKMTPYQQDLMLVAVEKMKKKELPN